MFGLGQPMADGLKFLFQGRLSPGGRGSDSVHRSRRSS
jgi:hypothetical protein